jgi:hypothetical protein
MLTVLSKPSSGVGRSSCAPMYLTAGDELLLAMKQAIARERCWMGDSPERASPILERPAVYVMRAVSSGPLATLSLRDMARLRGAWWCAGGGVPSSSC